MMKKVISTAVILTEISTRIRQYRIDYPMTQKELAEKTGISLRSITRFESGEDIQFGNLVKILCALELEDNIWLLVPDYKARPSYHLTESVSRRRASPKRKKESEKTGWKWGDEE